MNILILYIYLENSSLTAVKPHQRMNSLDLSYQNGRDDFSRDFFTFGRDRNWQFEC